MNLKYNFFNNCVPECNLGARKKLLELAPSELKSSEGEKKALGTRIKESFGKENKNSIRIQMKNFDGL